MLFWINAFVWTFRQRRVDEHGVDIPVLGPKATVPFITWPVQDEAMALLLDAIKCGDDVNLEKSREMGVSWLMILLADWYFLFHSSVGVGIVSRKEALVDSKGDMDSLFEKIRFVNRLLPPWMSPNIQDRYMHMNNRELGSTISGESTNTDVGRGGRKVFYIVDEAAAISNAMDIEHSLSQNTACQIWVSTPHGPNTTFHQRIKEKRGRTLQLPWYRHPEKAQGAYQVQDELGHVKWTSPWYQRQQQKYSSKTIAQEIDMDHGQAGDMFFDYTELERHRQDHEQSVVARGDIVWLEQRTQEGQVELIQQMRYDILRFIPGHGRKPWHFWVSLDEDDRPPQHLSYVFGVDISNGAGSSNSVITVVAKELGMVVAKFWDAYTSPEALAVIAASSGVWFGGLRPPAFIIWENNGPGGIFGRKLVGMTYPTFYRQRAEGKMRDKRGPRWGWNSNPASKEVLLGEYRDALARDALINPCKESLDEAADYIYATDGQIIPSTLREETSGGRKLHGDHVIADALAFRGLRDLGIQKDVPASAPRGSYAHRRAMAKRRQRQNDPWER